MKIKDDIFDICMNGGDGTLRHFNKVNVGDKIAWERRGDSKILISTKRGFAVSNSLDSTQFVGDSVFSAVTSMAYGTGMPYSEPFYVLHCGGGAVYKSKYGRKMTRVLTISGCNSAKMYGGVVFFDGNTLYTPCFIVAEGNQIFRSIDGENWSCVFSGDSDTDFTTVKILEGIIFVLSGKWNSDTYKAYGRIIRSEDGVTFSKVYSSSSHAFLDCDKIPNGRYYICGFNSSSASWGYSSASSKLGSPTIYTSSYGGTDSAYTGVACSNSEAVFVNTADCNECVIGRTTGTSMSNYVLSDLGLSSWWYGTTGKELSISYVDGKFRASHYASRFMLESTNGTNGSWTSREYITEGLSSNLVRLQRIRT